MALQVLKLPLPASHRWIDGDRRSWVTGEVGGVDSSSRWTELRRELRCRGRYSFFFADGRKQEEARKALESALGGKKSDFEKWNKEIEKRQEKGGGSNGRGGWFGGGGWFGWFGGDNFWEEAQQVFLVILGIVSLYLLITKGEVMFAIIFNSLLFVLRGVRNWLDFVLSYFSKVTGARFETGPTSNLITNQAEKISLSAKERVVKKWGIN